MILRCVWHVYSRFHFWKVLGLRMGEAETLPNQQMHTLQQIVVVIVTKSRKN